MPRKQHLSSVKESTAQQRDIPKRKNDTDFMYQNPNNSANVMIGVAK